MKLSLMRSALVLALALGLASCGGKAGFTIAGEVSGLQYTGLKLSTNGMTIPVEPRSPASPETVKFAFPDEIEYGEVYAVTIASLPANQDCALDGTASNTAGRLSVISVNVACSLKFNSVSGKVTGLTGTGLQLINGSSSTTTVVPSTATPPVDPTFSFTNIPFGQAYGITVYANPTGQVCTVTNGTGTMTEEGIKNGVTGVLVECKPA